MAENYEIQIKTILGKISRGLRPNPSELESFFAQIMNKSATPAQIGAFLLGLERIGLSHNELVAGAKIMRENMVRVETSFETIDVCGTGGDGAHSLNISTATALVLAGCGLKVAKHGNRSMSSLCGTADVLEELGLKLNEDAQILKKSLEIANIAFLFAPNHHKKLGYVGSIRRELGFGTVFNLLGPLCNPTLAKRQLLGIYRAELLEDIAKALDELDSKSAWVVHGEGGLDEIVLHGKTQICELKNGEIRRFEVAPIDFGLSTSPLSELAGGDAKYNAAKLNALLDGEKSAYRDAVIINSAASLVVAEITSNLIEAANIAARNIDNGNARMALSKLIEVNKNG